MQDCFRALINITVDWPLSSAEVPRVFRISAREQQIYWRIGEEKGERAGISERWMELRPVFSPFLFLSPFPSLEDSAEEGGLATFLHFERFFLHTFREVSNMRRNAFESGMSHIGY